MIATAATKFLIGFIARQCSALFPRLVPAMTGFGGSNNVTVFLGTTSSCPSYSPCLMRIMDDSFARAGVSKKYNRHRFPSFFGKFETEDLQNASG